MNLTRATVRRPVIALTVTAALLIFGVFSYFSLGLEQNPQLDVPVVTTTISYPGASARTVEEQVTRRVEDAIAALGNIETLSSVSRSGLATVTVEFKEGIDVDVAAADVQQRVSSIRRDLPTEVEEPSYVKLDLNASAILNLAVTGATDEARLYRVADDIVRPRIETVDGIGRVAVVGGRQPEVQVEVQPERLRAYGLSVNDVATAVRSQFMSTSGGSVNSGTGERARRASLRIDSRETDPTTLGALPVTGPDRVSTELRNVASIYLGGKEAEEILRVNGRPAAGLLVFKQSSANITQTVDAIKPLIPQINQELPPGYRLEVAIDQSTAVRTTVRGVQEELILAAVITGVVLFIFLHSLRSTIIVVIAIPASLLVTLIAMRVTGLTLNGMTLIGLTTAIGVLVDDSIVVLENIFRHLEKGKEPTIAAVDGRSEIGLAAIAITLVDVAVWGPIIFVTGVTGAFLRAFALVVVVATLASLVVSFTLTPLIASRWLKVRSVSHAPRPRASGPSPAPASGRTGTAQRPAVAAAKSPIARLGSLLELAYRAFELGYSRGLHWSLHHRPLVLLGALAALGINVLVVPRLGTEFVPEINRDTVVLVGELPPGSALEAADRAARRWEMVLLDQERFPEVRTAYVLMGRGGTDSEREPRYMTVTLDLGQPKSRVRTSSQIARAAIQAGEAVVPELQARLSSQGGPTGQPVQIRIYGDEIGPLTQLTGEAAAQLAALPELTDVVNSMAAAPELTIKPNPTRLMDLGVSTQTVGNAVRLAYQGSVVGRWAEPNGKERDVRVRLPERLRNDPEAVGNLPLIRRGPQMLTIRQVATESVDDTPTRISRVNRRRVGTIGAEPSGVPLGTANQEVTRVLNTMTQPAGVRWEFAGTSKSQQDSFRQLFLGLGVSIVMMYLLLTVLYESAIYPVLIISALPLATVGAFLGLLVFNLTLSLPAFIGLIALFGLVGKNSILLVDRANDLRRQGLNRTSALEQAGPSRLRPILMTSAVLVISMLPVAMKLGDGGEQRAPLGAVLVGGMTTSTFLSLLYVPVAYTYFDSFQTLLSRLIRWRPTLPFRLRPAAVEPVAPARPRRAQLVPVAGGAALATERLHAFRALSRRSQSARA